MKSIYLLILLALLDVNPVLAQEHRESINESFTWSNADQHRLIVKNIDGDIKVEGYNGSTVQITADLSVKAKSQSLVDQGASEVSLKFSERGNDLFVYFENPNNRFDFEKENYQMNRPNWKRIQYKFHCDIKIKVPNGSMINLSTINDGIITLDDFTGKKIEVNNINGPITMNNIAGQTIANALNKDIKVSFAENPTEDSEFYALNGDVLFSVNSTLHADITFKTLNGDFYTNADELTTITKQTNVQVSKGSKGTKYKHKSGDHYRLGTGGVHLHFDLLNGDLTIKEDK